MREELRQRLVKEYSYAVTKMQDAKHPAKILFYFSVFNAEANRILNWDWDSDLALIHLVTQQVYNQINNAAQNPASSMLSIDWQTIYEKLTQVASDLANYLEKSKNDGRKLCQILGNFAEISYVATGNGSYLFEKGSIKL